MTSKEFHDRRLAEVAEGYRNNGYEVWTKPDGRFLPKFLVGLEPDLLAKRGEENVIVEIKTRRGLRTSDQARRLADRLKDQANWRFDLVVIEDDELQAVTDADILPSSSIRSRLQQAERLAKSGESATAFLVAWTAVEATLRLLANANQVSLSGLSSEGAIRELVSLGVIEREVYRQLNELVSFRNRVVHGFGVPDLKESFVQRLFALAAQLLSEAELEHSSVVREDAD